MFSHISEDVLKFYCILSLFPPSYFFPIVFLLPLSFFMRDFPHSSGDSWLSIHGRFMYMFKASLLVGLLVSGQVISPRCQICRIGFP